MELKQGGDGSKWTVRSNHNMKCFTGGEIERMTSNYKDILGRGAFGEVYRGVLEDNSVVAVKKFVHNVRETFDQELTVHREINHKNVVRLIGYCVEENFLMMVTEYIPNGNLSSILHGDNSTPISLEARLRIATECAEALVYMHSYMYTQVIHGDIKPANILIDESLKAKISDFGISRLINDPDKTLFTEHVIGSIGYMDPLFARDGRLTTKSDVYSFGVVLVELITRKRAITSGGEANIVDIFTNTLANGARGLRQIFDAEIASQNYMKILEGVAKLAFECLRMERDRRPDMVDVLERLRALLVRASHQGYQRADLFSWARKSKPTPSALVMATSPSDLCRQFSHEEMIAARGNFLGVNFSSTFYCGVIDGGQTKVAISCQSYSHHSRREFRSAIETRSKLKHDHIVPLIGYCEGKKEIQLVYDFMAHGDLHHHLYENEDQRLTWKQRLEICIGVARALHYLHEGTQHAIIHGCVSSICILLDENWVAKVSDNFVSILGSDQRSSSYGRKFGKESDVYGFGVLLFEVLSAKEGRILPKDYMLKWALRYKEEGKLHQFYDPDLRGSINPQSLNKFAETAAKCVADQEIDRPSMEDVLSDLECALQLQVNAEAKRNSES